MNTIYKVTMGLLLAGMVIGGAGLAAAETVAIDMSSVLNCDAVAENGELQFASWWGTNNPTDGTPKTPTNYNIYLVFGQHDIDYSQGNGTCYISQYLSDSTGPNGTNLPMNGVIGSFEIGKGLTLPPGYSRYGITNWTYGGVPPVGTNTVNGPNLVKQTLILSANASSVTGTITLISGQQAKYSSFNLLFNGWRYAATGTFTTAIQAKYDGDASYTTVWQDVTTTTGSGQKGGTLASMGCAANDNEGGSWKDWDGVDANTFGTDGYQTVSPVCVWSSTGYLQHTVAASVPRVTGSTNYVRRLWAVDTDTGISGLQGINLNPVKVLTSLRIIVSTTTTARNRLYVYGITVERAPSAAGTTISFQ